MSEIDNKLYDSMGQRFAVVEVVSSEGKWFEVTAFPESYHPNTVKATNLKYSEAQAILKLMGDYDG